ncbi:MAG: hypothetical protein FWH38_03840, partial [Treponema sp.]|nr:hypothetical protein [Treponema sp.]
TEAVSKGIITASENTSIRDTIVTAASLDMLVGAEIGNVWDDGRGKVYAVACLEREKTAATYTEMIRTNQKNIESLTAMSASAKNTFDGYARYKLASLISGLNDKYANVVTQTGGALPASPNLPSTGALDQEASNIIKNISVAVNVKGDRDNRIRDAFSKALNGEGLRTQGSSTPYTLEAALSLSEAEFPNNPNKFCRYTVSANLIEKATGAVLLPFNLADRAGHATYEGAVANAITTLEKNIGQKFPEAFREYLAALLPKK